jgi:hypothetical protein
MSDTSALEVQSPEDRARWLLGALADREHFPDELVAPGFVDPERALGDLNWLSSQLPGPTLESLEALGADSVGLLVRDGRDRRWDLSLGVEPAAPHRLAEISLERRLPDGVEIREARPEDNEGILEVCRATAIDLGDRRVVIDPSPDYFAYSRLMAGCANWVATDRGRPVAIYAVALYPVRCGGVVMRMAQALHTRVHPDYASVGLFNVMNRRFLAANRFGEAFDNGCAYIAADNERTNRLNGAQAGWSTQPFRVTIPCGDVPVPASVRLAGPTDAARLVEILNATHDAEELYVPYTVDTLAERLSRDPALYGWDCLFISGQAVVSCWAAAQVRRAVSSDGAEQTTTLGLVLDYGFLPGHEADFQAALLGAAEYAASSGCSHLSIFTSEPSPGSELLSRMSDAREVYNLTTPYIPEPEGVAERGVYVDQIYF